MSKLIILRGNSGSGKSSAAKGLQQKLGRNTLILSQDTVRREMLWARDGADSPAVSLLIYLLRYGYERHEVVILEGILCAKWYQPLFAAAAAWFGEEIYAYYYNLSFEETLRRHATKKNRFSFGEEEMRRWWRDRDYIGLIPEKTIGAEMSLDEAVDTILFDIRRGKSSPGSGRQE